MKSNANFDALDASGDFYNFVRLNQYIDLLAQNVIEDDAKAKDQEFQKEYQGKLEIHY